MICISSRAKSGRLEIPNRGSSVSALSHLLIQRGQIYRKMKKFKGLFIVFCNRSIDRWRILKFCLFTFWGVDFNLHMGERRDWGALGARFSVLLADFHRVSWEIWMIFRGLIFHFHHNFSKSARIEIRFGTVAEFEKLNNFFFDRIEDCPW